MTPPSSDAGGSGVPAASTVKATSLLPQLDPAGYLPHPVHATDRVWSATNCYVDLWVELLHKLGADPVASLSFVFGAGFDGRQWDFVKYQPEDLRDLHGVTVGEMNVWKPFAEHVIENLEDDVLSTVEVDGYYLPDTAGTSYRTEHTKTTIVPATIDTQARTMTYFHNSGFYALDGDDYMGAMGLNRTDPSYLPPYVERVVVDRERLAAGATVDDRDIAIAAGYARRGFAVNAVELLGQQVRRDVEWVRQAGPEQFHLWSFGTLRQAGATAELAADVATYLDGRGCTGAGAATEHFLAVATGAKSVQFRMARAARGREVDPGEALDAMAHSWGRATDAVRSALL